MAPRKPKVSKTTEEEEKPTISINLEELEAKIRENAEELKKTEENDKKEHKKDISVNGERIKQNIEKVKTKEGIIGYILRNSTSASIDLKDPTKVIDYAVLSSSVLEASEELSKTFKLGDVKHVLVEGNNVKLLSFTVEDNKVSVFMEKDVDHSRVHKELLD
ncbi:MAG: roadblock/LC7 domain-containing protein [Candidatus Bathyarchaeota archaeon]|nr:roadblock/LC7 domain-containing protein [Candidatus Bathyarchaeota archaeon]